MASEKKGTIVELLIFLWKNTDCDHTVTIEEIQAYMNDRGYSIDRRTIPGHINTLNACLEQTGLEVSVSKDGRKNNYYISGRVFETEQIAEIIMAVIQSKSVSDSNSQEFIDGLFKQVSQHQAKEIRNSLLDTVPTIRRSNAVSFVIGELLQAINKHKKVSIMYKKDIYNKDKAAAEQKIVSPYCLMCNDNAMYLLCKCHSHKQDISYFRLDRITDITVCDETADLSHKKKCLDDKLEYNKKMTFGDKITVMLEFTPDASTMIYDRYGDIPTVKTDFGYKISQSDILSKELLGWLFMLGDMVKINGCEQLKTAFNERLALLSQNSICK